MIMIMTSIGDPKHDEHITFHHDLFDANGKRVSQRAGTRSFQSALARP